MKIAILSDFHLGFAEGTERADEAFDQASQALKLALENNAEIILHAGDLFDEDVPSQETWEKTFRLFSMLTSRACNAVVVKEKDGVKEEFCFSRIPVVAIHGTHEARGRDFKNALEVLESAGVLVHLHAATASFENLVMHGLSGVPEKKSLDALKMWNPVPVFGKKNVVLLHQSIKDYLPFDDDMIATISLSDLPTGFDLIVNGHLHWCSKEEMQGKTLVMPGSTVLTQMKRLEAEKRKGIFMWDCDSGSLDFIEMSNQRKFFYCKLEFKEAGQEEVYAAVEKEINSILANSFEQKPLVKLKLKGSLARGLRQSDLSFRKLLAGFSERAIISVDTGFEEISFAKKLDELRAVQSERKSITAMGLDLLEKNLAQTDFSNAFDVREFFSLFSEGMVDEAVERLSVLKPNQKV